MKSIVPIDLDPAIRNRDREPLLIDPHGKDPALVFQRPNPPYGRAAHAPIDPMAAPYQPRLPDLNLGLVLSHTWDDLIRRRAGLVLLGCLTGLAYTFISLGFFSADAALRGAAPNFARSLLQTETLGLLHALVGDFLLLSLFSFLIYRLTLLGEPIRLRPIRAAGLRRYGKFMAATLDVVAVPALAFLPYGAFIVLQVIWAVQGTVPDVVPRVLVMTDGPSNALKGLCAVLFYLMFLRFAFVLPAVAGDATYGLRDSWRATQGLWGRLVALMILTMGPSAALIAGLQWIWTPTDLGGVFLITLLSCGLWLAAVAAFTTALSIAVCLRTGWNPAADQARGLSYGP